MKTLIINGHPRRESFSSQVTEAYIKGAKNTSKIIETIHLHSLQFNLNLNEGYRGNVLEPDLLKATELIQWADHIVFIYPMWWWTMPALLKGFVDRVFVPDFAFKYHKGSAFQEKLLKGKTATIIISMDSPGWYHSLWMRNIGVFTMKKGVLDFCGIKTNKVFVIDEHKNSKAHRKDNWLYKVEMLGKGK